MKQNDKKIHRKGNLKQVSENFSPTSYLVSRSQRIPVTPVSGTSRSVFFFSRLGSDKAVAGPHARQSYGQMNKIFNWLVVSLLILSLLRVLFVLLPLPELLSFQLVEVALSRGESVSEKRNFLLEHRKRKIESVLRINCCPTTGRWVLHLDLKKIR